jgi:hypothetical protein
MFELHVSTDLNAGITASWCLSEEVIQYLNDNEYKDPVVLICIAPKKNYHITKEYRKIVPLKDLITYLDFYCAGENNIWACIYNNKRVTENLYLNKFRGEYSSSLINYDGSDWGVTHFGCPVKRKYFLAKPVTVEVPQEYFAKSPPAWEIDWVNWLIYEESIDQCSYRRQRIFAYTLQPIIFLVNMMIRFLCLTIALLIGSKNISLKYILHPINNDLNESSNIFSGGSYFIDVENTNVIITTLKFLCMPLVLIPFLLLSYFYSFHILAAPIMVLVSTCIIYLIIKYFPNRKNKLKEVSTNIKNNLNTEDYKLLTCSESKPKVFADLPRHKRTLKLRYYDLKSKVCRPFSR